MSGSNAIPPIRLTLDGQDAVERGMEDVARAAERMAQRTQAGAQQMGTLATAADDVGARLGTLSTRATAASMVLDRMGQSQAAAGLGALAQVLDTAAIAASRVGANALAAETGVSSFFARMATGATIIGAVAAGLQAAGLGINAAGEGASRAADYTKSWEETLVSLNRTLGTTAERAQAAALALWRTNQQAELMGVERQIGRTFEARSANVTEFNQVGADIARQERRVAEAELALQFPRMSLQQRNAAERQAQEARARLEALRARSAELVERNAQLDRDEAERVGRRLDLLRQSGPDDLIGPPAPAALPRASGGGGGRAPAERDPETGYTAAQAAALQRASDYAEREAQRTAEREARDLERREDRNNRVTDRIVDYSAERFAELFDKNGRGWEGMLETLERTAKSTIARIAAELVLRPIIAPIVSALGLGALGTGNGGFSGIGGLVGGGDASGGGGGTGGLSGLFGLARSGYSAYSSLGGGGSGGGMLGGLSGYISNPIYTQGAGWFAGTEAIAASQWAALGPGAYGPVSGVSSGAGGALGGIGAASIGSYAAGIGLGYMGGSMLGGYIAGDSPARRQNAQLGAGGGAVAGAMIGAAVTGPFAPIGAVVGGIIGGLAGGAGGGMIGPGRGFAGGDVGIGVGPDGQLRVTQTGGKRWDAGAATADVQRQLDAINALLRNAGVSIGGMGEGTLGWQGSGESSNVFGPTEIFNRIRPNLSSTNANLQQVLASGRIASFDELGQVAGFITQIYEPLGRVRNGAEEFNAALAQQMSVYDQAIAKAKELGLAETALVAARDRVQSDVDNRRDVNARSRENDLILREAMLSGNPGDIVRAQMGVFRTNSRAERISLRDTLRQNGYGDDDWYSMQVLARFDRVTELERERALQDARFAAGASGRSLMEDLTVGGLGGLSPAARYAAGLRVLQDARASGNLDRITAAARTILPVARDYLGTSERFGALTADIARDVRRAGGDPVGLGVFLEGQAAGNQALERIYGLNNLQLTELKSMRGEISRLNAVLTTLMQRG